MNNKLTAAFFSILLLYLLIGSRGTSYAEEATRANTMQIENIIRIKVFLSGQIVANDKPITLDELKAKFSQLKGKNTAVWYYRESGNIVPSPETRDVIRKVMDLIIENKIPVSLSSKPDFSDYIDEKGQSHPRNSLIKDGGISIHCD